MVPQVRDVSAIRFGVKVGRSGAGAGKIRIMAELILVFGATVA
jgi:hypothetical protein